MNAELFEGRQQRSISLLPTHLFDVRAVSEIKINKTGSPIRLSTFTCGNCRLQNCRITFLFKQRSSNVWRLHTYVSPLIQFHHCQVNVCLYLKKKKKSVFNENHILQFVTIGAKHIVFCENKSYYE